MELHKNFVIQLRVYSTGFNFTSDEHFGPLEESFCHGSYRRDILLILVSKLACVFYSAAFDSSRVPNSMHCIELK